MIGKVAANRISNPLEKLLQSREILQEEIREPQDLNDQLIGSNTW